MTTTTAPVSRGTASTTPPAVPQPRAGDVAQIPTQSSDRASPGLPAPRQLQAGTLVRARVNDEQLLGRVLPHDTSTIGRLPLVPVKFGECCRILLSTDLSIVDAPEPVT